MELSGNNELRSIWKNILFAFVIWVIANHTIAFLTPRVSPSGSWLGYAASATLRSVDGFRRATGGFIGRSAGVCPGEVEESCRGAIDVLKTLLGVNS